MRDRLVATLALSGMLAGLLPGCVSNPNAMVFGTNTVLGISAGASATNSPSVTVGYKRQEAVVMPLVANVNMNGEALTACKIEAVSPDGKHPCLLTGSQTNGPANSQTDSLSVLASFGTEYGATATNPEIKGAISQYFATGLAARRLAEKAGSSAVALGPAAVAGSVVGASEAMRAEMAALDDETVKTDIARRITARDLIAQNIVASGAGFAALLPKLDDAAGTKTTKQFQKLCDANGTADACAKKVRASDGILLLDARALEAASKQS